MSSSRGSFSPMDKLDDMDNGLITRLFFAVALRDRGPLWPNRYVGGSQIPGSQMRVMRVKTCNCNRMVDALTISCYSVFSVFIL